METALCTGFHETRCLDLRYYQEKIYSEEWGEPALSGAKKVDRKIRRWYNIKDKIKRGADAPERRGEARLAFCGVYGHSTGGGRPHPDAAFLDEDLLRLYGDHLLARSGGCRAGNSLLGPR